MKNSLLFLVIAVWCFFAVSTLKQTALAAKTPLQDQPVCTVTDQGDYQYEPPDKTSALDRCVVGAEKKGFFLFAEGGPYCIDEYSNTNPAISETKHFDKQGRPVSYRLDKQRTCYRNTKQTEQIFIPGGHPGLLEKCQDLAKRLPNEGQCGQIRQRFGKLLGL